MQLSKSLIPNSLTLLGMFFGFASVTQTLHGQFVLAAWLLAPAAFLDLFDGMVAKLLHATSSFGAEVDSFSDLVAFGAAPSVLIYGLYFSQWGVAGIALSFLPLLFGALRLTRFNLHRGRMPSDNFTGLPIPCVAGMLAGFVILTDGVTTGLWNTGIVTGLTILVSLLMVSSVPFTSNAVLVPRRILKNWLGIAWLLFFPALLIVPRLAFFVWTSGLIAYGLMRWVYSHLRSQQVVQ